MLFIAPTLSAHRVLPRHITLSPRPTPRPCLAPLPRHALDLGMEALVAQGLALVRGEPYVADGLLIDKVSEQTMVGHSR